MIQVWIDRSPAMSTPQDLADAMRDVADYLDGTVGPSTGPIRDSDGCLVGRWEMSGAEAEESDPEGDAERRHFQMVEDAADIRGFNDGPPEPFDD